MTVIAAALAVAAFVIALKATRLVPVAIGAVDIAREAVGVMGDASLSDEAKEKAVQAAALRMMGSAVSIALRVALTLLAALVPIYLFSLAGLADAENTMAFLLKPWVIVVATVVSAGAVWAFSKSAERSTEETAADAYSPLDRALHRIAFAAPFIQTTAADIEDTMFARQIAEVPDRPPVFITSLPRAGTTVLLNAMSDLPCVATHRYRDMPFVMAPMLWARMSKGFQKSEELHERAHKDGLQVGYDSPEAFEEVIWRHFWPGHYLKGEIRPWSEKDANAEATAFLKRHFRKIVALRTGPEGRYVSKNNGNIARLPLLRAMFPEAAIVVPLRDPAEHAASLMRQHRNFLQQHAADPFIRRYMADIGHLEFGELHRPIAFPGLHDLLGQRTPDEPDYWLAYWVAAMDAVRRRADDVLIVEDAALQEAPERLMGEICRRIGVDMAGADVSGHFRKIPPRADRAAFDPPLLERAEALYRELARAPSAVATT